MFLNSPNQPLWLPALASGVSRAKTGSHGEPRVSKSRVRSLCPRWDLVILALVSSFVGAAAGPRLHVREGLQLHRWPTGSTQQAEREGRRTEGDRRPAGGDAQPRTTRARAGSTSLGISGRKSR